MSCRIFKEHPGGHYLPTRFEYTQADVYGMTEMNSHWRNLDDNDKLHKRMSTWFEACHQSIAYNTTVRLPKKNIDNMEELVSLASTRSVIELWGRVLTQADWEDGVPLSIEGAMG